jgi:Eukaryotic cytochrome b561
MCSAGGLYAIYKNKENHGSQHWTTTHAMAGVACILSCIGLGLVGGIVLHPDFGIDKTNKTIRYVGGLLVCPMRQWFDLES